MPADTKAQPAPFRTIGTQAGVHAAACGVNSSLYAYLNRFYLWLSKVAERSAVMKTDIKATIRNSN